MVVIVVMYVVNEFILKIYVYLFNEYMVVVIVYNEFMNWIKGCCSLFIYIVWRGVGLDIIYIVNVRFFE